MRLLLISLLSCIFLNIYGDNLDNISRQIGQEGVTDCLNCQRVCNKYGLRIHRPLITRSTGFFDSHERCFGQDCQNARGHGRYGVWLPEDPLLFKPFIADPRQVGFSVGWRFNDQAITKNVIPVSYANYLGLYRWCNVWPWCGELEIAVEGCLWAVFDPCTESAPLVNADYYVAIPISYAVDCWQYRLRLFHISSHIGDEFLLNHPDFDRKNPSAEYLDFFVSHYLTNEIRLYGGLGWVIQHDESFKCGRFYAESGVELRFPSLGFTDCGNNIYGLPFYAMHFRYKSDFKRHGDATYVLGWEWGKLTGMCRAVRLFLEYHDGYSVEGQFCKEATNYFSVRLLYGW